MKKLGSSILTAALAFSTLSALAQGPGGPPPRDTSSGPQPPRDGPGREFAPPPPPAPRAWTPPRREPPLFAILDTNHDGVIDTEEIVNASLVLARVAKEHGGQLTLGDFAPRRRPAPTGGQWRQGGEPPMPDVPKSEEDPRGFAPWRRGPEGRFDGPPRPPGPMGNYGDWERGPARDGRPPGGPDQGFDGPRAPRDHWSHRRSRWSESRGQGSYGRQQFNGPRDPQGPEGNSSNGDYGTNRPGRPPLPPQGNQSGRPEAMPGQRPGDNGGYDTNGAPPPRPGGPGPRNGNDGPGRPVDPNQPPARD